VSVDTLRRHRAALAAAGLLLAILIGTVAWRLADESDAREPRPGDSPSPADAALAVLADRLMAPPEAASVVASAVPAASAVDGLDPACPPAWRALAGQPESAIDAAFRRLRPGALARAAALLAASADPFERVAAQVLSARARAPDEALPPDAFLALVSEALGTGDLRVAGLAAQLCGSPSAEPPAACASFTPSQWAAMDPENMQPWLAMAAQAQDNGDPATVREAMARAAQARSSQLASTELARLARSPALQALAPVDREVLVIDLLGVGHALTAVGSLEVSRLCPSQGMGLARVQQCSAVAERLVEQSPTLIERGIGISIGRRTGWPAERVAALEEEHRALLEALGDAMVLGAPTDGPMTAAQACEAYQRIDAMTSIITTESEVALARRALAQARAASTPR
jgi:hypothetical protein